MNHGADFQALWKQLRNEVRALQNKGYYGDGEAHVLHSFLTPLWPLISSIIMLTMNTGYWSAGTRLADSSRVGGQGIELGECPEYMVGPLFIAGANLLTNGIISW